MSQDKTINAKAARIAAKDPLMRATADKVMAAVKADAEKDRDSGGYVESLAIVKGKKDLRVIARSPGGIAIEYGHMAGKTGAEGRSFVPGKFYMTKAAAKVRNGG